MSNTYIAFLPNYYTTLLKGQTASLNTDNLYFYVADGINKEATANSAPKTIFDEQQTITQVLYGGRVIPTNFIPLIRRIDWVSGKTFAAYDSRDPNMNIKDTYCLTSSLRVYKCLVNNNNSPSIIEPSSIIPGPFETADGYQWILMYSLTNTYLNNYSVQDYIPVIVDNEIESAALPGTITTIDVLSGGNYLKSHNGTIQQKISNNIYRISDSADNLSGVYNNMAFYVSSDNSLSQITQYTANTSGKFVTLNQDISVTIGDTYNIAPHIKIDGNGVDGSARAIMNSTRIEKVQILNPGHDYTNASISIISDNSYTLENANLRTNLSPIRGHGADVMTELYTDTLLININIDDYTVSGDIPWNEISFAKAGLIRYIFKRSNPGQLHTDITFNNMVKITATPAVGNFNVGDRIHLSSNPNSAPYADIVHVTPTDIRAVYQTPNNIFDVSQEIQNQVGIKATISEIVQPQILLDRANIVAQINSGTILRNENSNETIQIVVKIRNNFS